MITDSRVLALCAQLPAGDHRASCPSCERGPADRALSLRADGRGGALVHCFRCGLSGVVRLADDHFPRSSPARRAHRPSDDYRLRELWNAARPIDGVGRAYLEARGCAIPPAEGHLRFLPRLRHPVAGIEAPALVALVTSIEDAAPITLHRTWIRADGRKADLQPPRMLLAGRPKRGGCIRLWPDDAVTCGLGIAEGIESALALAWAHAPVWAAIDAGNLTQFPLLEGIESLVIAADHDQAGLRAARECARRWAGRDVRVVVPPEPGTDLADVAGSA